VYFEIGVQSSRGRRRSSNEDAVASLVPREQQTLSRMGAIFAVADGMAVHASRRSASRVAIQTVVGEYYRSLPLGPERSLKRALAVANQRLGTREEADALSGGTGTTLVAAVVYGHDLLVANVGDSRAYMFRGSQILRLTRDHSWTAEALAIGALTTREAARHPWRHVVTRALGMRSVAQVDFFRYQVQPRDILLLCSDGVYTCISDGEMRTITNRYAPHQAARKLGELAKRRRSGDDATALVVRVTLGEPLRRVARRQQQVPEWREGRPALPIAAGRRQGRRSAGWHAVLRVMGGLSLAFLAICVVMFWLGGA
jgi:serine/threonine protein phosphatase PrpC